MTLKDIQILSPGNCACYNISQVELCKEVHYLEMGRLSWITQAVPKYKHKYLNKMNTEKFWWQQPRKQGDNEFRDWSSAATNQGMLAATRSWRKWETDPSPGLWQKPALQKPWLCGICRELDTQVKRTQNTHKHSNGFYKDNKAIQWRKDYFFNKRYWISWTSIGEEISFRNKKTLGLNL